MKKRGSGILLHITSLPSKYGIGDTGPQAYKFVDFLNDTKQSLWQILPLNPTDTALGNSPYSSASSFGGNPLLISPELMVKEGFLKHKETNPVPAFSKKKTDYIAVGEYKDRIFHIAYDRFRKKKSRHNYDKFCKQHKLWLDDFALFMSLKQHFQGKMWSEWPAELRDRHQDALHRMREELSDNITYIKFLQYIFFKQWFLLKKYCYHKNIQILGDMPIYITYDSVDVWTNPELFKLKPDKQPVFVAGVPPDYFSKTGQLWGNPVYDWNKLKGTKYSWWIERVRHNMNLFDLIRIDHFRGMVAYWEIPAGEKTAINGKWVEVPVEDFFNTLLKHFPNLPIIAEDLGIITPDVREVMRNFNFPGMKVLLFAFGENEPKHPYLPHMFVNNCVVYTGTHDNNTVQGWFSHEAKYEEKERLFRYIGRKVPANIIHIELIRLIMMSTANMVIFPLQDVLGLGKEARMNIPSTKENNWEWRVCSNQITSQVTKRLLEMTTIYARG